MGSILFDYKCVVFFLAISINVISCQEPVTQERVASAAENVIVIDSLFNMEGLDRTRNVRIYLPQDYDESKKSYPVLYMHDGQNLFDDVTSYVGEWGVDEILNKMKLDLIVVGIDNGQMKRMNEMGPWDHEKFGKSETKEYLSFIINQVKPYIDSEYRTKKDRKNTAMMGSSMGGLVSHYAVYTYPDIFGKVGIFSPSYWFSDEIFKLTNKNPLRQDTKIYIIVGSREGKDMVKPSEKMYNEIINGGHPKGNIFFANVKGGSHGETFWRQEFEASIKWLYSSN